MCERIKFVLIFTLLITTLISTASQPQSFLITKYSTDNGLPDNRVNDIAQDSLGRIWIVMDSGIAMYDGIEWKKFGRNEGVPEVEYIRMKIDEKGIIWFLPKQLFQQKLVYLKDKQWKILDISLGVVNKYNRSNSFDIRYNINDLEIYISLTSNGLSKYVNGTWSKINSKNGLISDTITAVLNVNGKIYVSTDKGISIIDKNGFIKNFDFKEFKVDPKILGMVNFRNDNLSTDKILLFSREWIGEFSKNRLKSWAFNFKFPFIVGMNIPSPIIFHPSGNAIFGNVTAAFKFNFSDQSFENLFLENSESDRGPTAIMIDYENNIWMSSLRGVYKLIKSPFQSYSKTNGLLENEVSAISQFNSGQLVFGHNYGISIQDDDGFRKLKFKTSSVSEGKVVRILDIAHESNSDLIYFVSVQNGIGRLSKKGELKWIKHALSDNYTSICILKTDVIYVTTIIGIGTIKNDLIQLKLNQSLPYIKKIKIYNDTLFYCTTHNGLLQLRNNKIYKFYKTNNIEADNINSLDYSEKYGLLVGSVKGLYKLQEDSLIKFNFNEYDITDPIYFIIQDSVKNIWLGTNNGVLKWDGKDLRRYNKSDGLAGNETNRAAGFVDDKGNVWIGTDEGVSMYLGNEQDYEKSPPKIMLLDFKDQANNNYAANVAVSLNPNENNLTFQYRGLSFLDEKSNSYQIKLKEVNEKWENEFYTSTVSARFNNLAAGDYIFSVRVKNSKGVWSKWQSSAVITIDKFYYQKLPFQLGVFVLFLFLTYSAYSYIQQKKYAQKLEQAVDLRTKNLRDTQVELITSIDRYKGIVESQTDLVVRFDPKGIFTFVNDAFCKIFGKTRGELIGSSFTPLVHPEDIEKTKEEMEKLKYPNYRSIIEQRALTVNGFRWISWEGYAIHNSDGSIMEIQGVGRDITIQKEIESELEKRVKERTIELESLISQSPMGIVTFNSEGYMLSYNNLANELFGNLNSFLLPDKRFNLFEDEFLLKNNYKDSLSNLDSANGIIISKPIKIDDIKNEIYKNLVNHFLIYRIYTVNFDENNKIYVLLLEDVTEQQKSEEINNRLLEEKIRFSTIIKTIETERDRISKELHDGLGQMLTTAKLKLDILKIKSDKDREEINDALGMLINAGDEIRRIINDLKPADVEKFGLIASIELLCERIKQTSKINIQFTVSNFNSLSEKKDELVLYRIVQEALNNIVKHSNCTNAKINIYKAYGVLNIEIWDDGSGYQLENLSSGLNKFGISNIQERVKNLNGQIDVQTQIGEGVQIKIKIPV